MHIAIGQGMYLCPDSYIMSRIPQLTAYLQDQPNDTFLRYALALEYIKAGQPENALTWFEGLVASDPEYIGTYYHLAKLYIQLKRPEDAELCYTNGIAMAQKINDQHALSELKNAALNFKLGLTDDD